MRNSQINSERDKKARDYRIDRMDKFISNLGLRGINKLTDAQVNWIKSYIEGVPDKAWKSPVELALKDFALDIEEIYKKEIESILNNVVQKMNESLRDEANQAHIIVAMPKFRKFDDDTIDPPTEGEIFTANRVSFRIIKEVKK